jgi:hypothetical protein
MTVEEFRAKVKPGLKLSIEGKDFLVKEVVKFRFDDGSFYIKCWLDDGHVFADDLKENMFIFVKQIKTLFAPPFDKELGFDMKTFIFLYSAHAIAEEIWGEEIFKKGDGETFWDYKSENNWYLSLGESDNADKRLDFYGRIIENDSVKIYDASV